MAYEAGAVPLNDPNLPDAVGFDIGGSRSPIGYGHATVAFRWIRYDFDRWLRWMPTEIIRAQRDGLKTAGNLLVMHIVATQMSGRPGLRRQTGELARSWRYAVTSRRTRGSRGMPLQVRDISTYHGEMMASFPEDPAQDSQRSGAARAASGLVLTIWNTKPWSGIHTGWRGRDLSWGLAPAIQTLPAHIRSARKMWIRVGRLANNPMAPVDWQNTVKIPNRRGGFTVFEATPGRGKVNLEAIFVVTDTVNIPPRLNLPGAFRTFMPQMRYIIARSLRTAMKRAARRAARRLG